MKKVAALFFLVILLIVTSNKTSEVYPVFNDTDNSFYMYKLNVLNNSVNTKNIYDIFSDTSIIGIYVDLEYYKFNNYDLKVNISEFENYYKEKLDNLGNINKLSEIEKYGINISNIVVYTTISNIEDILNKNKFLDLE